jgi:aspartyl-tRNA(Asn)/glutamyl-tRNA(Gln) amidotransferase subunit B
MTAGDERATIGLEVHVQLQDALEDVLRLPTRDGAEPNTQVCPVCLGYPGAMPVMNEEAIRLTVRTGLMLGSRISAYSKFDRKSYFYPDMPKNYQISQYDRRCAIGGASRSRWTGTAKTGRHHAHPPGGGRGQEHALRRVERRGLQPRRHPLMEIVTSRTCTRRRGVRLPAGAEADPALRGVSDCNLEEGNMRCDVNCQRAPGGQDALGTKTEIKNMNTFKGVHRALQYEIARRSRCWARRRIVQETRRWDDDAGRRCMRTKEDAHDYRYFPEPDLMPVVLDAAQGRGVARGAAGAAARAAARFVAAVRPAGVRRRRAGGRPRGGRLLRGGGAGAGNPRRSPTGS